MQESEEISHLATGASDADRTIAETTAKLRAVDAVLKALDGEAMEDLFAGVFAVFVCVCVCVCVCAFFSFPISSLKCPFRCFSSGTEQFIFRPRLIHHANGEWKKN